MPGGDCNLMKIRDDISPAAYSRSSVVRCCSSTLSSRMHCVALQAVFRVRNGRCSQARDSLSRNSRDDRREIGRKAMSVAPTRHRRHGVTDAPGRERRNSVIAGIPPGRRYRASSRRANRSALEALPRAAEHGDPLTPHVIAVADRTVAYRTVRHGPIKAGKLGTLIDDSRGEQSLPPVRAALSG